MTAGRLITDDERRARLGRRHRLVPSTRTDDVDQIADDLVALHSSDPVSVFLAAGARMENPSIAAVEDALYVRRTLLRHHAMRRTLWVMAPETARLGHASSTRKFAATERRRLLGWLADTPGVGDAEGWLTGATERAIILIADAGTMATREVGQRLPDLALPITVGAGTMNETTVSAHARLLLVAGFEGKILRTRPTGSWVSSEYQWAPAEAWTTDGIDTLDEQASCAALLQCWLGRFGPGTMQDLRWWTGWTARSVKTALAGIGAVEVALEADATGWTVADDEDVVPSDESWVAVLPGLDPSVMGWKDRSWYLPDDVATRVFDRNGNAGPTVWVDGRIVGSWAQRRDGQIVHDLPAAVAEQHHDELVDACSRVAALVGDTRFRPRFRTPGYADLMLDEASATQS